MIETKKQMALECVKAEHKLVRCPKVEEIRGNLLRSYKRYMRLDKQTLHHKCLIAMAYNCDIMQRIKLYRKKPSIVDELRQQIKELSEKMEALNNKGE